MRLIQLHSTVDDSSVGHSSAAEEGKDRLTVGAPFGTLNIAEKQPGLLDVGSRVPAPSPNTVRTGPLLQGHSLRFANRAVVVVIVCVCVLPLVGLALDFTGCAVCRHRAYTWWVLLLIVASYGIWIPAIFSRDFSFNIGFFVPLIGTRVGVTQDEHNGYKEGPIHESTRTLVRLLWNADTRLGAVLVALYAFAVPTAKLLLLVSAEALRFRRPGASRSCVFTMQLISKWAAPDMFGYILLYHLIRQLQHPPLDAVGVLDVGFTCYSVFSVTCAVSSLGVPLPRLGDGKAPSVRPPVPVRLLGLGGVALAAALLCMAWLPVFLLGLARPCFAAHLDSATLSDHVPQAMKFILRVVRLEDIVPKQQVSIFTAMRSLAEWFHSDQDLNLLLAFVLLLVFTVLLTLADMLCLLFAAYQLWRSKETSGGSESLPWVTSIVRVAHILRHISMLDVLIMGVIVCTLAGATYRKNGFIVEIEVQGLTLLIVSEALHYVAYHLVSSTSEHLQEKAEKRVDAEVADKLRG